MHRSTRLVMEKEHADGLDMRRLSTIQEERNFDHAKASEQIGFTCDELDWPVRQCGRSSQHSGVVREDVEHCDSRTTSISSSLYDYV